MSHYCVRDLPRNWPTSPVVLASHSFVRKLTKKMDQRRLILPQQQEGPIQQTPPGAPMEKGSLMLQAIDPKLFGPGKRRGSYNFEVACSLVLFMAIVTRL